MNDKLKYVAMRFTKKDGSKTFAVTVFESKYQHNKVYTYMYDALYQADIEPTNDLAISAGFLVYGDGSAIEAYGRSESLNANSVSEDTEDIVKSLAGRVLDFSSEEGLATILAFADYEPIKYPKLQTWRLLND